MISLFRRSISKEEESKLVETLNEIDKIKYYQRSGEDQKAQELATNLYQESFDNRSYSKALQIANLALSKDKKIEAGTKLISTESYFLDFLKEKDKLGLPWNREITDLAWSRFEKLFKEEENPGMIERWEKIRYWQHEKYEALEQITRELPKDIFKEKIVSLYENHYDAKPHVAWMLAEFSPYLKNQKEKARENFVERFISEIEGNDEEKDHSYRTLFHFVKMIPFSKDHINRVAIKKAEHHLSEKEDKEFLELYNESQLKGNFNQEQVQEVNLREYKKKLEEISSNYSSKEDQCQAISQAKNFKQSSGLQLKDTKNLELQVIKNLFTSELYDDLARKFMVENQISNEEISEISNKEYNRRARKGSGLGLLSNLTSFAENFGLPQYKINYAAKKEIFRKLNDGNYDSALKKSSKHFPEMHKSLKEIVKKIK